VPSAGLPRRARGQIHKREPASFLMSDIRIRAERVATIFQHLPLTAGATVINAALMAAVLVAGEHDNRAYVWLVAVLLLAGSRLGLWWAYRRRMPAPWQNGFWGTLGVFMAFASGVAWGSGSVLLFPLSETYQLFWAFLIGGMCAGAAAFHSAHLPTAMAYIVPAGLPLAVRFASEGTARSLAAATMIAVFLVVLTAISWQSSRRFGDMLRLQFNLAQRTSELDAANSRLTMEIAEHRETEETLRHAQKMEAIGQLTGGIAHDFNNLLTIVLGSLELLLRRSPPDDAAARRLLDNAVSGAKRGAALTQRLLAFGRRQTLKPEPVDIERLVRGMSELLCTSLGAGVRIEMHIPIGLGPAYVDANQLELALLNLAVNARDAMPGGGDLTITAREQRVGPGEPARASPASYIVLSVTDTGEGMDEATLTRAMEPFFTTKDVGEGTGLGLSMVHGLAVQSGGQLVLHSRKGAGTTAELWLLRAEVMDIASAVHLEPAQAIPARCRAILVVDDDPLVLTSTVAMLEELGHAAIAVASGQEALQTLRTGTKAELVITDYAMPGMTGLELAASLQHLWPTLPVLLATGYAELQATVPTNVARISKPFGLERLAEAIEQECLCTQDKMPEPVVPH